MSSAQHYELIEAFQLSESEGNYGIYANIDPTGASEVMFDMNAPNYSQNARMLLPITKFDQFLGSLSSAREYYLKWCVIAKNQSVTHFSKNFPVKFIDQTMLFTSDGKWHRENGVNLSARFYVDGTGKCYLVLDTDYMTSDEIVEHGASSGVGFGFGNLMVGRSSNETSVTHYCAGASLFFSSEQEIDSFIDKLKRVRKRNEQNVTIGKLFK
jgi:hypothetical protein